MNVAMTGLVYDPKGFNMFCTMLNKASALDLKDNNPVILFGEIQQEDIETDIRKIGKRIIHCFKEHLAAEPNHSYYALMSLNTLEIKLPNNAKLMEKINAVRQLWLKNPKLVFYLAREYERREQYEIAVAFYRGAAQEGDANSMLAMARLYYKGLKNLQGSEVVPINQEHAFEKAHIALELAHKGFEAGQKESLDTICECGSFFIEAKEFQKALECYEFASKNGHGKSTAELSEIYLNGIEWKGKKVLEANPRRAVDLKHLAGLQGHTWNFDAVAHNYRLGGPVPEDHAKFCQYNNRLWGNNLNSFNPSNNAFNSRFRFF